MVAEGIEAQGGERFGVVTRVARQLGVGTESLRNWLRQAEIDGGQRPGTTTEDKARIAALEKENRELRRANEILKSAAFFGFMWLFALEWGEAARREDGETPVHGTIPPTCGRLRWSGLVSAQARRRTRKAAPRHPGGRSPLG